MGTYAIVKIRGAKLIGTDKTCHSKFPYSKQEKKMFSYITYIIASLIQHIKPVTSTELQQCGVACSPLSPPQRPLCIVGGGLSPCALYFWIIAIFIGIPSGSLWGGERFVAEDSCSSFLISDVSGRCGCGVNGCSFPSPSPLFYFLALVPFFARPKPKIPLVPPQVAQARNMSIDEHRHCCVTFEI